MELSRLIRVFRERWRLLLLVALIGFVAAFGLTSLSNRDVSVRYEALVPIRFELEEGETVAELADTVNEAQSRAAFAAKDLIGDIPGGSIFVDTATGRLFFRATGDSQEEALGNAEALVQTYVQSDPGVSGNVDETLAQFEQQAIDLQAQIDSFTRELTADEQALVIRHDVLDRQIVAITDRLTTLIILDARASAAEQATNATERTNLDASLQAVLAEKATLPPRPSTELSPAEQLRLDALQRRLELLSLDYENAALRALGVTSEGRREPPTFDDLTPEPANPAVNGVVGLIGGAALALFALVFITRSRREIWLPEDLPIPLLGEIPWRKASASPGPTWYDSADGGTRKESIQTTRTAIEGLISFPGAAVTISGDEVVKPGTHAFAADLAASFASAGHSTLLVDADFSPKKAEITEYEVGEPTLGSLLVASTTGASLSSRIEAMLEDAVHTRTDLAVVPSGPAPGSPADALAGRAFRSFIDAARERFDLVVVVTADAHTAAAQVPIQRIGHAVIAVSPGKSTIPRLNATLSDLVQQRVGLLGAVMIHGTDSRLASTRRGLQQVVTRSEPSADSGSTRLSTYPFPGAKRTLSGEGSLALLSRNLNELDESPAPSPNGASGLGEQVLAEIQATGPTNAYEAVAGYLVARVEDLVTAVGGQEGVPPALVEKVTEGGYLVLTPIKDHKTVGEWFVETMRYEVGDDLGQRLADEFARVVHGDDDSTAQSIDSWLMSEFFSRHIERSGGEPEIWHLASNGGSVQLLVHARRLTDDRIGRIARQVVRRRVDELERLISAARDDDDAASVEERSEELKEVHKFEIALGQLRAAGSEEAKLIYPWRGSSGQPRGWSPIWTEGIKANIAPLQRLDLLSEPVLSPEELEELQLT